VKNKAKRTPRNKPMVLEKGKKDFLRGEGTGVKKGHDNREKQSQKQKKKKRGDICAKLRTRSPKIETFTDWGHRERPAKSARGGMSALKEFSEGGDTQRWQERRKKTPI